MVWTKFYCETMNPIIHVESSLSYPTCFNIIEDQVHPFLATVFNDGNAIIQQDNVP